MNAPIDQTSLDTRHGDPLIVTAMLWRGTMIERFARMEFFVNRTARLYLASGLPQESRLSEQLPRKRFAALLDVLGHPPLDKVSAPARTSLNAVIGQWDLRNALCHGRTIARAHRIRIEWAAHERNETGGSDHRKTFTLPEMLAELQDLDALTMRLGSQLGSIDTELKRLAGQPR